MVIELRISKLVLNIFHDFRVIGACVLVVYLATLYGTYVPDWNFVVQNPDSVDFGKTLTVSFTRPSLNFTFNISISEVKRIWFWY